MILAEKIIQHLEKMPESAQTQVFDFVKYLESKTKEGEQTQDETEWLTFSLSHAMRGMENEQTPYLIKDIKEVFS
ncbi:DUF2281 domain-containing protein [bacterium]|nr:DUF2281 domain-containing protein [bacterium]MBU1599947.1 DUF2281 domain-containing protein [bacterium]MBU2461945.1 DUF2281 domain-containing protein [bacterium]